MAVFTAIGFALLGCALLFTKHRRALLLSQSLALRSAPQLLLA
jgi:hypothetical protein